MHGSRRANLELANHLYKTPITISFIQINEDLITHLMEALRSLKVEVRTYYPDDEVLLKETDYFIKTVKRVAGFIGDYSTYFRTNNGEITKYFTITKRKVYSDLFRNYVKPIIELIRVLRNEHRNGYLDKLTEFISQIPNENTNVFIITKNQLSDSLLEICNRKIPVVSDKELIDSGIFVDILFFIGTPSYYNEKFSEIFYAKEISFLGYSCFENRLIKRESFSDLINKTEIINTVYRDVTLQKGFEGINFRETFDKPLFEQDDEKLITEFEGNNTSSSEKVEAKLATISNGFFIFLPVGQKINVLDRETLMVHQESTKELVVGDLLVFRSHNGSNLVREVADQILGQDAKIHRNNIEKWKRKLRININNKGISVVSKILRKKYKIKNGTENNVKHWISTYSIKPQYLKDILDALKFEEQEKGEILRSANLIFSAHISAGHKISHSLMEEISSNTEKKLDESGFYKFKSKKFEGASFNIEEIKKISKETYSISSQDVLKVIKR